MAKVKKAAASKSKSLAGKKRAAAKSTARAKPAKRLSPKARPVAVKSKNLKPKTQRPKQTAAKGALKAKTKLAPKAALLKRVAVKVPAKGPSSDFMPCE